ncbi:Uncharacterised protein [Klebsiella pneumoniae subsp. ozaenae]|uniref:Uncharacterized protein n=1 Tax=Klebsiella pneumoniae subsp. ozaenae TaxID=574 RepID=A0A378UEX6_KLEPO|nr:Uncharacterised protein [Klebsiella pneumoniae subsp. ozaenae]
MCYRNYKLFHTLDIPYGRRHADVPMVYDYLAPLTSIKEKKVKSKLNPEDFVK